MLLGRLQKNEAPFSRQGVNTAFAQNQNSTVLESFKLERPSKTMELNLCPIPTLSPRAEHWVIPWMPPEVVTPPLEGQTLPMPDNPFHGEIPGNSFPSRNSWKFLSLEKQLGTAVTQPQQSAQSHVKGIGFLDSRGRWPNLEILGEFKTL